MGFSLTDEKKDKFVAFWQRNGKTCPCIGFQIAGSGVRPPVSDYRSADAAGSEPSPIDIEALSRWCEGKHAESAAIAQDAVWTASPPPQIRWLERMIAPEGELPWVDSYNTVLAQLVAAADGRYPVATASFSGIVDLMVALVGSATLQELKTRSPQKVADLGGKLSTWAARIMGGALARPPEVDGGTFLGDLHLWAPGRSYRYQERQAHLFSAEEYRNLVLPSIRSFLRRFDYTVYYVRHDSLHLLDEILPVPEIDACELFVGPQEPAFDDLLPVLRRIQEHGKSLIVRGMIVKEDFERARDELSWKGVYLLLTKETLSEARFWASYLASHSLNAEANAYGEAGL